MNQFLKRRWLLATVALSAFGTTLVVVAILWIGKIKWAAAWPWLALVVGLVGLFAALVVQSYAPPGPNLIERAAGIPPEPIFISVGIALALVGILFWFDFGVEGSSQPSDWWVLTIASGAFLLLIGVMRTMDSTGEASPMKSPVATLDRLAARLQLNATKVEETLEAAEHVLRDAERLDTVSPADEALRDAHTKLQESARGARDAANDMAVAVKKALVLAGELDGLEQTCRELRSLSAKAVGDARWWAATMQRHQRAIERQQRGSEL